MRNNVVFLSLEEKGTDFKKNYQKKPTKKQNKNKTKHTIVQCLIEEEKVVL